MYRIFHLIAYCGIVASVFAQTSIQPTGDYYVLSQGLDEIDHVVLFRQIDSQSAIHYTGSKSPVNWYDYNGTLLLSNSDQFLMPENNSGYRVIAGSGTTSDTITFYVLDYKEYQPTFNSLFVDEAYVNLCEETRLILEANLRSMSYHTPSNLSRALPQTYKLSYNTLTWSGEGWTETTIDTLVSPANRWDVKAPLTATTFKLTDITYIEELGIVDTISIESDVYQAIAIDIHPTSITEIRTAKNEIDRPSEATSIKGSAPLVIQFLANANEPVAEYYDWKVKRGSDLLVQRSEKEHRYTFEDAGIYDVTLNVTNTAGCSDTASFRIEVSISSLRVPNVFTPNGDGKNDEFRVAYRSLLTFSGHLYNRWGRKVFAWTDPQKGWDGTINGQPASPGVYFYVIQAEGSDGVKYRLKGDVTLIGR
ncbi:MAG: gliding motility-associated C-terminal domain-containing protein [Paludibacteraceae bacterium]|nr:gliding motility-associated C-terminal domain-containing protein [Paludibacteraceae bacterium]